MSIFRSTQIPFFHSLEFPAENNCHAAQSHADLRFDSAPLRQRHLTDAETLGIRREHGWAGFIAALFSREEALRVRSVLRGHVFSARGGHPQFLVDGLQAKRAAAGPVEARRFGWRAPALCGERGLGGSSGRRRDERRSGA